LKIHTKDTTILVRVADVQFEFSSEKERTLLLSKLGITFQSNTQLGSMRDSTDAICY
jgi:hypothetical protein